MIAKLVLLGLLSVGAFARPQQGDFNDFNAEVNENLGGPFDPNPQYTYSYQVASDEEQTYLAHSESRDGEDVTGEYSYVDPLGSLITVRYTAGANGYTEERTVQEGFVTIRSVDERPPAPVAPVRPAPPPRRPEPVPTPVENNDSDLVARIIAQLTPFIRQTVSSSLQSGSNTAPAPRSPAPRPAPVPVAAPAPRPAPSQTSVQSLFGEGGANNVRLETPNFSIAYDLKK